MAPDAAKMQEGEDAAEGVDVAARGVCAGLRGFLRREGLSFRGPFSRLGRIPDRLAVALREALKLLRGGKAGGAGGVL